MHSKPHPPSPASASHQPNPLKSQRVRVQDGKGERPGKQVEKTQHTGLTWQRGAHWPIQRITIRAVLEFQTSDSLAPALPQMF